MRLPDPPDPELDPEPEPDPEPASDPDPAPPPTPVSLVPEVLVVVDKLPEALEEPPVG